MLVIGSVQVERVCRHGLLSRNVQFIIKYNYFVIGRAG